VAQWLRDSHNPADHGTNSYNEMKPQPSRWVGNKEDSRIEY